MKFLQNVGKIIQIFGLQSTAETRHWKNYFPLLLTMMYFHMKFDFGKILVVMKPMLRSFDCFNQKIIFQGPRGWTSARLGGRLPGTLGVAPRARSSSEGAAQAHNWFCCKHRCTAVSVGVIAESSCPGDLGIPGPVVWRFPPDSRAEVHPQGGPMEVACPRTLRCKHWRR